MKRFFVTLVLLSLALSAPVSSQSSATIIAPAVERAPDGLRGVLSSMTVVTQEGSGHVYIDTWPLAEVDIQGSARLAVQAACNVVGKDWREYDFFITVRSDSPIIGGPSAGGAMTVAVIAALEDWELTPGVVMSGTINPDETVGPVGGLYQKAQAASQVAHLFLVPEGQTTVQVEEQQTIQQGPFTFMNTTQREVNLVEEGKKMGLEVKEVYDIRDAVYYFTGKRIEPPSVKGEPINSDFMKPFSERELSRIEREYTAASGSVSSSSSSSAGEYKNELESLLKSAQDQIDYAHTAYDEGKYYMCVNAAFVAGVYVTYTTNLLSTFEGKSKEELFSQVDAYVTSLSEEIKKERPFGMTALQCIAAAQKDIFEAEEYLLQAQGIDSLDYVKYLSYAQRRGENAEFWLDISREYRSGEEIASSALKNAASSMVNTANLSLVYASSILPKSDILQEAGSSLNSAEEEFGEECYAASLFFALESKVYSDVALITYASSEDILQQRIDHAQERAKTAIALSRERGVEPVLAVSYYELAESFPDPLRTLISLGYAREVASISTYIESQPSPGASTVVEPGTPAQKENELLNVQGIQMGLLWLAAGVCVGIGTSWIVRRLRG